MDFVHERTTFAQEESVVDLIKDLRDEAIILVRQQVELAKTETGEKVARIGKNTGYLLAGGAVLYAGTLFLLAGLTYLGYVGLVEAGLSPGVAMWLMPLITGVIVGIVGWVLVSKALKTLKHTSVVPEKTVHSIKEDKKWLTKKTK